MKEKSASGGDRCPTGTKGERKEEVLIKKVQDCRGKREEREEKEGAKRGGQKGREKNR